MAAAEAAGESTTGKERKGDEGGGGCEEDIHSGLDLFNGTAAL